LTGISITLETNLGRTDFFTILSLLNHECTLVIYLCLPLFIPSAFYNFHHKRFCTYFVIYPYQL
jgi:hypothetical protein